MTSYITHDISGDFEISKSIEDAAENILLHDDARYELREDAGELVLYTKGLNQQEFNKATVSADAEYQGRVAAEAEIYRQVIEHSEFGRRECTYTIKVTDYIEQEKQFIIECVGHDDFQTAQEAIERLLRVERTVAGL